MIFLLGPYTWTSDIFFRSQAVLIKLVLPQAAQLDIHFLKEKQQHCTSLRDLFEDPLLRIEREKALHPAAIKPTTSLLWGVHSTTVLQPLPMYAIDNYPDLVWKFDLGSELNSFG